VRCIIMWVSVVLLFSCLFVGYSSSYQYNYCSAPFELSVTNTSYTLEFVQVITRHGDRTTLTQLPGDHHVWQCNLSTYMAPVSDQSPFASLGRIFRKNYLPGVELTPGNCYAGELTTRGFEQHMTYGQNLRQLYVNTYNFLPQTIDYNQMGIRSTDVPRTLASAQGNSVGLYPPQSPTAQIPVVDVWTMDQTYENMVPNSVLCPRSGQLLDQVNSEPEYLSYMKSLLPLQQKLSQVLGIPLAVLPDWPELFDAFQVMTCYNQSYPGLDDDTIEQIFAAANWQWNYQLNNSELAISQLGSFAAELVNNIQAFIKGDDMPKYLVFSGHDTTVGPLLASLNAYDGQWPPYASHIELELWSDAGKYYVQLKYQGEAIVLSSCSTALCPLAQFMAHVEPVISIDYPQFCAAQ